MCSLGRAGQQSFVVAPRGLIFFFFSCFLFFEKGQSEGSLPRAYGVAPNDTPWDTKLDDSCSDELFVRMWARLFVWKLVAVDDKGGVVPFPLPVQ